MPRISLLERAAALAFLFTTIAPAQSYTISTFAGGALPVNILGTSASLCGPQSAFAIDPTGNLFFADGNTILRLDANTGLITLVAGNGTAGYSGDNGPAVSAQLHGPDGLALDAAGNLYITSFFDHAVRMVSGGVITTVVGTGTAGFSGDNGPAGSAQLNSPYGLALDSSGNLYISDYGNNRIRMVAGGVITTIAGNGIAGFGGDNVPATSAQLNLPRGIAVDASGNLYIADSGNNRIRAVSGGVIGTVAGNGAPGFSGDNGPATAAQLQLPTGVAVDSAGSLYIADYYNNRIRRVSSGTISTVAGKGIAGFSGDTGPATQALLNNPLTIAVDYAENIYLSDYGNNRIRKIAAGVITTVAGNGASGYSGDGGSAISAQLHLPAGVALDAAGNLYIADAHNNVIRKVSGGLISTLAGNGTAGFSGDSGPAASAQLNQPTGVALDGTGSVYIADSANNRVRKVSAGVITTLAGNGTAGFAGDSGPAASAQLNQPAGVALDSSGNLYIADTANNRIRKITGSTITTVAGTGAPGSAGAFSGDAGAAVSAHLNAPASVALDAAGNLYIADSGNNRIRKVSGGTISTVAGTGSPGFSGDGASATAAALDAPTALALEAAGNLYIADTANDAIRRVSGGTINTIAGGGESLGDNGAATSAALSAPQGIALDATGNVYVADTQDNRVRLLTPVPLAIAAPDSLPSGTVGAAYTAVTFTASGGAGGYTWSVTGLPKGFTFTAGGVLSGTPAAAATSTLPFTVKDSSGTTAGVSLSLTVSVPVPAISTLSPASVTAGAAAFTLTVNGTGFTTGTTIQWNGTSLTTKLVSATQLTAPVTPTLIASPGSASVTVVSGGSSASAVQFPINAPTPGLTSMAPTSATATGSSFTLTVTGKSFVSTSQVQWNAGPLATTFVSATQLTASVTADLIASTGTASVTVSSGGAPSGALTFTIGPAPSISSLNPASVVAYGAAFTLTVTGTGFASGASVQWGSTALSTKFVSATQLTAAVPSNLIGGAGDVQIAVISGGVTIAPLPFTITAAPPAITSLNPASAVATSVDFTLTVNGSGLAQGDTVQWNGTALPTTWVSQSQLTAYVAAALVATTGSASVLVSAGSVSSAASKFTITAPPAVTTLNPPSAVAGSAGFTLTVTGTGFLSGAQVQWNGAALPTTFGSATQLTAAVPASLVASAGSVTILVSTAGASSTGVAFTINGPPAVTSLSPAAAAVGGAAFTLTVTGTGFVSGATVSWNGTALTTKFVSATQLTASVTAALIASGGIATITANSGGVATGGLQLPINPPPAIAGLSPATVSGTGAPFTLTVNGTGFVSGTIVQWGGTARPTTFVSGTQVTAAVPVNLAAGNASVSIIAANPGGISSAAQKLSVTAAPPAVTKSGVVPIYSPVPVIQPGSWVSIYGTGLARGTFSWKGDFPTSLGGTTVTINKKQAYLWSVSPTQINLQAPTDTTTGPVDVVVTNAAGSMTSTVTLAAYGPSFSLFSGSEYAASLILTPNGSGKYGGGVYDLLGPVSFFAFGTRPALPGEILVLYGVGFGPTKPAVPAGKAFIGTAPTTGTVAITIGGLPAKVLFSGITEAGVYQFNLVVPQVGSGDQPLIATVGGVSTPAGVLVTIQ
jgi:uncharacterized protein (TIGR03437 family)